MVHTFEEAQEILAGERHIALDLETGGFSPWTVPIHVIVMYGERSKKPVILHYPRGRKVPLKVLRWLEGFEEITTHNGTMFDILFLANAGMDWTKVKWYDTMIGELAVITADRRDMRVNLQASIRRRTGKEIDKNVNHESWGNEFLDHVQLGYLHGDITHLIPIRQEQFERAEESPDMMRNLLFEMELIPAVVQMQLNGLPISVPGLHRFLAEQEAKAALIKPRLEEMLGKVIIDQPPKRKSDIIPNSLLITSPKQVKEALAERFGAAAFPNTTKETFQNYLVFGGDLAEISQLMLDFRHADRREKMYAVKWQHDYIVDHGNGDTRVHGKFWQIGTNTGRFSSSQPNLQQIPRDMRAVFASDRFMIGATDYSGIEVRVAAALADDEVMIDVFTSGRDIHREVAAVGFNVSVDEVTKEQRQIAKAMSFTLLFGGGAETFKSYAAARGSTISLEDAEVAVERFFETYDGIRRMRQSANWQAKNMRAVTLVYPTGLKRVLFNQDLRGSVILNNIVQGTAAAGLKYGLLDAYNAGLGKYLSAVVHDEVVYTAPPHEIVRVRDAVEECMIRGMLRAMQDATPVPVEVESQHGWSWEGDKSTEHVRVGERSSIYESAGVE